MVKYLPSLGVAVLVIAATSLTLPPYGVIEGARWIALTVGGGVALMALPRSFLPATPDALDLSTIALFAFALLSFAWTPDRLQGMHEMLRFLPALVLFFAARRWSERAWSWVPYAAAASLTLILVTDFIFEDWLAGFGNYNKAVEAIVVLLVLACAVGRFWRVLIVVPVLIWLLVNNSHTEIVGFGAIALLWLYRWFRRSEGALGDGVILGAVGLIAASLLLSHDLKTSLIFRLEMAATSVAAWIAAPFAGHGVGSFAYVYPFHSAVPLTQLQTPMTMIEAAHNEPLQIAVEFGAVGLGLAILVVVMFVRRARFDPYYASALAAIAGVSLISYPLREPATLALFALCAARLTTVAASDVVPRRRLRWALVTVPLVAVAYAAAMLPGAVLAERQHAMAVDVRRSELPEAERSRIVFSLERDAYGFYPFRNYHRIRLFPALVAWLERDGEMPEDQVEDIWNITRSAAPRSPPVVFSRMRYVNSKEAVR